MAEKYTLEQIRDFWAAQARQYGTSPSASWSDRPVIDMEIRQILAWLADGDQVLDVGCANGYSTIQFAAQKKITIRGLDYIPEMIEQARLHLDQVDDKLLGKVAFDVGDITALNEPSASCDKVVVVRVLINLGSWPVNAQVVHHRHR